MPNIDECMNRLFIPNTSINSANNILAEIDSTGNEEAEDSLIRLSTESNSG